MSQRADDVLGKDPKTISVIKIDIEGHECHALRGLTRIIETHQPILIAELSWYCLERLGSRAGSLFAIMAHHGHCGLHLSHATRNGCYTLVLRSTDQAQQVPDGDVAWIHTENLLGCTPWLSLSVKEVRPHHA